MCGLAAMIGLRGRSANLDAVERMTRALVHRGPDDKGFYHHGGVGFGFRRLSILDLSADGHQPMHAPDGEYVIIFNGELYNYVELRDELKALGHRFRSTGDTEVLLNAYRQWGAECLTRLNGMWAFLIHDRRRDVVFGSRDRFGIKPLYLHWAEDALLVASEIKAVLQSGLCAPKPNWGTAARFLVHGVMDDTPETFYAGIEQLPAATAFELRPDGRFNQWRYWSPPQESSIGDGRDANRRFADLFEDAVRLEMRSDVPVGVCLSGGLDSTSIICSMARQRGPDAGPLLAFSFNDPEFDESGFLRDTVNQTGATLVPLTTTGLQLWERLDRVIASQDEPVHSMTAIVGYGLMELARQHGVTVVLNGQGADETLAGYPSYFRDHWYSMLRGGHPHRLWSEVSAYARGHDASRADLMGQVVRHATLGIMGRLGVYRRIGNAWRRRSLANHPWYTEAVTGFLEPERRQRPSHTLNDALARSVAGHPLPLYLRVEDRNAMAHSVEVRVPFLDHRLVTLAFELEAESKLQGPWNKYLLRESMAGRIPESVRTRVEKMGFPTPTRTWIAHELYQPLRDLLSSQTARERSIYRVDALLADMERTKNGAIDAAAALVRAAQFEIWMAKADA